MPSDPVQSFFLVFSFSALALALALLLFFFFCPSESVQPLDTAKLSYYERIKADGRPGILYASVVCSTTISLMPAAA